MKAKVTELSYRLDVNSLHRVQDATALGLNDAACFLLSDLARAITGEVLHVDGGLHAMAAPLSSEEP